MDEAHGSLVERYFEQFLPQVIGKSIFADLDNLSVVVRFFITDGERGWTISLEKGQLIRIERGSAPAHTFSYNLDAQTLLQVVSGTVSPQKAFFTGKVKIQGDTLKGLKLAMIFDRFIRAYPFTCAL